MWVDVERLEKWISKSEDSDVRAAMVDRDYYEVESILRHQGNPKKKSTMRFLVKWRGYDDTANSWQLYKDMKGNAVLNAYLKQNKLSIRD